MKIVIPTYGRVYQKTYSNLPEKIQEQVIFFKQQGDPAVLDHQHQVTLPENIKTIAATRDFIIDWAYPESVLMLDDDLEFATRREENLKLLQKSTETEILRFLQWAKISLDDEGIAHIAMSPREGASYNVDPIISPGRPMRVLGYNTRILRQYNIRFEEFQLMEDFHVALALLTRGYENCIYNNMTHNQGGSNNQPGGCTGWRTLEMQAAAAYQLEAKYPQFVKAVVKQTKTSWQGKERVDVRIQWVKALRYGREAALLDAGKGSDTGAERDRGAETLE
jgi:hypothetical protein